MSAEAASTIRDRLRHLHSADFAQIAVESPEARQDIKEGEVEGVKVIDLNVNKIAEENEDDGKIVYSVGMRYLGHITNHQPQGLFRWSCLTGGCWRESLLEVSWRER